VKFDSTDPLTARSRFVSRKIDNIIRLSGIFLVSVLVLSWAISNLIPGFSPMLVADALMLGGVYYLYVLWEKRPIKIRCPHCKKIISSRTPWVCMVCGTKNIDTENHPFVACCKNKDCGSEPKAYRCHHQDCRKMIFLTEDEDDTNYAHNLNSPDEIPAPDEHAEKLRGLREMKEKILAEREIAILKEDMRKLEKLKKTDEDDDLTIIEKVEKEVGYIMGHEEAEAVLLKKYAEDFKGNPALVRRYKMAVNLVIQSLKSKRM
jgi:hypothetical protein